MKTCKCGETDLSKLINCSKDKFGVDIICTECRKKVYRKRDYIKNKDKIRRAHKKYRIENKDKIRCSDIKYCSENKDKIRRYQKKYQSENKKDLINSRKSYCLNNKDKIISYQKKYRIENKDKVNDYNNKRSLELNNNSRNLANNHYQEWTSHDFEIAVRKRESGSYIFTKKEASLRLGRTISSIGRVRHLNSKGFIPSDYTGKRSEYFNP